MTKKRWPEGNADDYGVDFGPNEQLMVETSPGVVEKCLSINGISRMLMECEVGCDLPRFVAFASAIKKFMTEEGSNVTAEDLKRFDDAVALVIADKAVERIR